MPIEPTSLVATLEDVMFRTPHGARGVEPLAFEGVRGRRTPEASPYLNLVGVAAPGAEVPDASIERVIGTFAAPGLPFGWLVGPHSPEGLGKRLAARGLTRAEEFAGLALFDLAREIPGPGGVTVREVGPDQRDPFAALLSRAFGLPPDTVAFLCEILYFAESEVRARNYFAWVDGTEEPVAVASTLDTDDPSTIVLAGSAVLEGHRGHGVYRALVRRRLDDARRDGARAAVIQAVRSTSAPICRNLGFEEVCAQALYAWSPD